jgi:predicted metallo-beta-lactamase superfamily hydrolase
MRRHSSSLISQWIDVVGKLTWFGDVRIVIAHSIYDHHDPFIKGASSKGAVCVGQMMQYRHDFV